MRCRHLGGGVDDRWKKVVQKELPNFSGISVRERQGDELLKSLGIENVRQCLDPVLLLEQEEWEEMASSEKKSQHYCLGYFLNGYKKEDIHFQQVKEYCDKNNMDLKIIPNQGAECFIPQEFLIAPDPEEFLALFRDAACVIANSFHAAVFAIVFKKPFVLIPQKRERKHQNDRFISLFDTLGLESRLLVDSSDIVTIMDRKIDFDDLNDNINILRSQSLQFLSTSLKH